MESDSSYSKNPNIIDKETENGLLLFDTEFGKMVELNSTAKLIWQKTGDRFRKADMKRIIEDGCMPAKDIENDMEEFIESALKFNLVVKDGKN